MSKNSTRSKVENERDELVIQRVVENLLSSETFISKLCEAVTKTVRHEFLQIVQGYEQKVNSLENDLSQANTEIADVKEKLEWSNRANSILIYGIPEPKDENIESVVVDLGKSMLKIEMSKNDISECYRLGRCSESKPRVIVVKFARKATKMDVFSMKKKLKGTNIIIREDLTPQRFLMLKEAINKYGRKSVWTSNGVIMVKLHNSVNKIRSWSDLNNL